MGKRRLRCPKPPIVDQTTSNRINLALHLLCERLRFQPRTPLKKVHLPCFRPVRMSQTSLPQLADPTIGLSPMKFDRPLAIDHYIAPIAVKSLTRRTDTVTLVFADRKIPVRSVKVGHSVVLGPLFSESVLVSVGRIGVKSLYLTLLSAIFSRDRIEAFFNQLCQE